MSATNWAEKDAESAETSLQEFDSVIKEAAEKIAQIMFVAAEKIGHHMSQKDKDDLNSYLFSDVVQDQFYETRQRLMGESEDAQDRLPSDFAQHNTLNRVQQGI